jgi:hypothetical protein
MNATGMHRALAVLSAAVLSAAALSAAALSAGSCGGKTVIDSSAPTSTTSTGAAGGSGGAGASAGTGGAPTGGSGGLGTGGGGVVSCNPNHVMCATAPPSCVPGEVPSVHGGCWGECVPVLSCAAETSCADCQGGFCAEYAAWTVEYRCVLPSLQCSSTACGCLAPYFCVSPYDSCSTPPSGSDAVVSCSCPTC